MFVSFSHGWWAGSDNWRTLTKRTYALYWYHFKNIFSSAAPTHRAKPNRLLESKKSLVIKCLKIEITLSLSDHYIHIDSGLFQHIPTACVFPIVLFFLAQTDHSSVDCLFRWWNNYCLNVQIVFAYCTLLKKNVPHSFKLSYCSSSNDAT